MYAEADLLPLSAIQHLIFCERQCALIHVEQVWRENAFTAEGRQLHEKAHSSRTENRGAKRTAAGMALRSLELGLSGKADVVEFIEGAAPYPVEYKRGRPKARNMDEVQLCAQAICLEEMLGTNIPEGALFYGKKRRRKTVRFDQALRDQTADAARRLHEMFESGRTPSPQPGEKCKHCSLNEVCLPDILSRKRDVGCYVERMLNKELGNSPKERE